MDKKQEILARVDEAKQNGDRYILVLKEELKQDMELKDFLEQQGYALYPFYDVLFKGYKVFFTNVTHRLKYNCEQASKKHKEEIWEIIIFLLFSGILIRMWFLFIYQ